MLLPPSRIKVNAAGMFGLVKCVIAIIINGLFDSCWAFSATETIESAWILAGKSTADKLNLAPQQIVDCDGSDGGCEGGEPPTAYDYGTYSCHYY